MLLYIFNANFLIYMAQMMVPTTTSHFNVNEFFPFFITKAFFFGWPRGQKISLYIFENEYHLKYDFLQVEIQSRSKKKITKQYAN